LQNVETDHDYLEIFAES